MVSLPCFFTLNPHDIRSPITLALASNDHFHTERFSLDLDDAATESYLEQLLGHHPRRLHEIVVQDPLVAARCFHYTVRLVIQTLFHCSKPGRPFADCLPCRAEPGVFQHVAGYLGVVEPQMRKSLHLHMLIQLHGFAHPRDLFRDGRFRERFRSMWYFVASICFRSTEAFAAYTEEPGAWETLAEEALLPITPKQRGMIGKSRVTESVKAYLVARGLTDVPQPKAPPAKPVYYVPGIYADASVSSSAWAAYSTRELCSATRKSGNHVCRSDVCHKGKVGQSGFCRLGYWHWVRSVSRTGELGAVRAHGLPLQPRWDGGSDTPPVSMNPPFRGHAALEVSHPFHIKMNPAIYLGPRCSTRPLLPGTRSTLLMTTEAGAGREQR